MNTKKSNIMIARNDEGYEITVKGRATFECSPPLRNFAENIVPGSIHKISINLTGCTWLDSTFMGTLAMLGLNSKKAKIELEIINIDPKNFSLLKELGIEKLFKYNNIKNVDESEDKWNGVACRLESKENDMAETILEAHKTLMNVDESNIPKFRKVVDFVEKDLSKKKR